MQRLFSAETILLSAITLLAAFFRFYRLDQVPPGFQFDQAFNAFDFLRLLQGQLAIFFPANTGREPLYFYLSIVSAALFGQTAFAVKLTSAVIGVMTVPLIFLFARSLLRSRTIALLAAFFSAISLWHIFFSRDGLRVILEVPLTLFVFWYLWRATGPRLVNEKVPRWGWWLKLGLYLALALYTYPSARLLPIAVIFLVGYAAWQDRSRAREMLRGMALAFGVAAVCIAPLGIYFALHTDEFFAHTESISVFDPRVSEGNILAAIWKNMLGILGMFFLRGDASSIHNLPQRPIFDALTAAFFVVGAAITLVTCFRPRTSKVTRARALFLGTWIAISLASSLFSDDAPNFLRMLPAFPAIITLPALGAHAIWLRLNGVVVRQAGAAALVVSMAVSTAWVYRDYFVTFANLPELYYTFDVDKVEVADWINANEKTSRLFLAPLWYQQGTISLLTHNARLKTFDSRDTIVLPSGADGQDALYGFPPEQEQRVLTMAARLGSLGARENIGGTKNLPPMHVYRVAAQNLPDRQNPLSLLLRGGAFVQPQKNERTEWSGRMALVGSTVSPEGPGGRNLTVTLFLHALTKMNTDYTFSIKVFDDKNRVWGQEDKWAGDNSYETSHWDEGDLIIEKFYPGLTACAPAGDYSVLVEAYNPKTSEVLALSSREGNSIPLGGLRAGASEGNLYENLDPDHVKEVRIGERLQMLGYTLSADSLHPGENFSLSLFWRGVGKGSTENISIKLGNATLAESAIQIPAEGRGICGFFDLTAPVSAGAGALQLRVNDSTIAQVNVVK